MTVRLNQIDLNLLKSLDTLLRERSVTRAAELSHVTQQAMSGTLKRLRDHFEDELLLRVGLKLELTPLGQALLKPVRDAMLQIESTFRTTPSFVPATSRRQFKVALSDYAVTCFLPLLLARIQAQAPFISFMVDDVKSSCFKSLEAGDLDLTVQPSFWRLRHEDPPTGLRCEPLFEDEFACAVDATMHPECDLSLHRYLQLSHSAVQLHGSGNTIVVDAWERAGLRPHVAVTTTSFSGSLSALPSTLMIATVQRALIRKFARSVPLRVYACPFAIGLLHMEMYWHERFELDPAHEFVREQLRLAGQDMSTVDRQD